jgi:hypothetical protein
MNTSLRFKKMHCNLFFNYIHISIIKKKILLDECHRPDINRVQRAILSYRETTLVIVLQRQRALRLTFMWITISDIIDKQ